MLKDYCFTKPKASVPSWILHSDRRQLTLKSTPVEQLFAVVCVMYMGILPVPALHVSQELAFQELVAQYESTEYKIQSSNIKAEKSDIGTKIRKPAKSRRIRGKRKKKMKRKFTVGTKKPVCTQDMGEGCGCLKDESCYADVLTVQSAARSCIQAHISYATNDRLSRELHEFITTEDTCSMVNCIVKGAVDPSWVVRPSDTVVKGVGGKLVHSIGRVTIPNHSFVYCGDMHELECDIVESLPRHIDVLIGLPTIVDPRFQLVTDLANSRTYSTQLKETLRLDDIDMVYARRCDSPKRVLSACAGLVPEIGVLLNMGWRLEEMIVVESEQWLCDKVCKMPGNFKVTVFPICDVTMISLDHPLMQLDIWLFICGPPCTPWSRCSKSPYGFTLCKDDNTKFADPCAAVFVACAEMLRYLCESRSTQYAILETTVVHKCRACDIETQCELVGGSFCSIDDANCGSAASRPRRVHVRGVDSECLNSTDVKNVYPDNIIDGEWSREKVDNDRAKLCVANGVFKLELLRIYASHLNETQDNPSSVRSS